MSQSLSNVQHTVNVGTTSTTVSGNSSKRGGYRTALFWVFMYAYNTYAWQHTCVCRGQRSFSSVVFQEASTLSFFCCFVFLKTETGCLVSLYIAKQTILPCRGTPEILLSLPLQCWNYMCVSPHSAWIQGSDSCPHACKSILPPELSSQT